MNADSPEIVAAAVARLWSDIEAWMRAAGARALEDLGDGASETRIRAFEDHIKRRLPADLRASKAIHDGQPHLGEMEFFSLERAGRDWAEGLEFIASSEYARRRPETGEVLKPLWLHEGLVPLSRDSAGNMLYVDLAPGPNGSVGQIVAFEWGLGPRPTRHASFLAWLTEYRDDLHAGRYEVDEEGDTFEP